MDSAYWILEGWTGRCPLILKDLGVLLHLATTGVIKSGLFPLCNKIEIGDGIKNDSYCCCSF